LEQAEEIAARDAESEEKRAEWKAEAAKELENWHAKQNEVSFSFGLFVRMSVYMLFVLSVQP
jgi:hypothetical protein